MDVGVVVEKWRRSGRKVTMIWYSRKPHHDESFHAEVRAASLYSNVKYLNISSIVSNS